MKTILPLLLSALFFFTHFAQAKEINAEVVPIPLYISEFGLSYGLAVKANNLLKDKDYIAAGKLFAGVDADFILYHLEISSQFSGDVGYGRINRFTKNLNLERGSHDKDNFSFLGSAKAPFAQFNYLSSQELFEFSAQLTQPTIGFSKFYNKNHEHLAFFKLNEYKFMQHSYTSFLHFLDSVKKPKQGASVGYQLTLLDAPSSGNSSSATHNFYLKGYYSPIQQLTFKTQLLKSQAEVTKKSNYQTKEAVLASLKIDCQKLSEETKINECTEFIEKYANYLAQQNTYGTAKSLGGSNILRSYDFNELRGKHAQSIIFEISYGFAIKNYQFEFAVFQDLGQTADSSSTLSDKTFSSTGAGLRLDLDPIVVRFDYAKGNNDTQAAYLVFGQAF